jgi:hypothetical protein
MSHLPSATQRKVAALLAGAYPPGLYVFGSRAYPETIRRWAEAGQYAFLYIDGAPVVDKASFFESASTALQLPAYFGHNWDAFEESIRDLSWLRAPGYLLLYDYSIYFSKRQPDQFQILLDILAGAAAFWQSRQVPFYALLRQTGLLPRKLPKL